MFGEEDVLKGRKYSNFVRCNSTSATLYCIKADLLRVKLAKDDKTWKIIEARVDQKEKEGRLKILKSLVYYNCEKSPEPSSEMPSP
mmetsp:Transcript_19278/g.29571  ORF Transcript_19278/g.29571 Transcript_19278/m.29571 type:complete len:86 (+) Transcript_19278:1434-1691(+)